MPSGRRRGVQSIDRAVTILRCFDTAHPELGISDLARRTGLSTSTTHRLLSALQDNGLVRQSRDRRYALGPLLLRLARVGAAPASVLDAARPVMTRLRDEVDETVGLHVLLPTRERAVIDQVESRQPLRRTYTEFGAPIPLPLGAPGKVLLAALPYDVQEAVLARPVTAPAAGTSPDGLATPANSSNSSNSAEPDVLRKQLVGIRRRNVAFSRAERTSGIRTVAAAVFDGADLPVASLSVSAPAGRMPEERMEEYAPLVVAAAWSISEQLGATREGVAAYLTRAEPPPT
ncbi:IclR family transcriptional regulator [Actinopolymorpha rutila]|uniref:Glycerol operon regulatory protein n=1 Tax=Actinopolymorpha rutila TaxID=446787 RepID=A0A852Z9C0_9ACTN|nr:IclR family transcriptional regulator [Actinopolymorpha rutila]NYH89611.1 IclR family acetate operon transcriptional repressor [Actinopolymorpha rutila]